MTATAHHYSARLVWTGNAGTGTADYAGYGREYRVLVDGKPELAGTADPAFRGDPGLHNPEELFLSAISACHMLTYLALCARRGVRVVGYQDDARGSMRLDDRGGGKFEEVTLCPAVTIEGDEHAAALAARLHDSAHELCFIASSCSIPIRHDATIIVRPRVAPGPVAAGPRPSTGGER